MLSRLSPNPTPEPEPEPEPEQSPSSSRSGPNPPPNRQPSPKAQSSASPRRKLLPKRPGRKLLAFDRRLGARFVAGTDEAGRGSLAGPLVVAGVLPDYQVLRDHRVRPLALLNDSKQLTSAGREELFGAVLSCAERVTVRAISAREIDAEGLHRSNLAAMRSILWELSPPAAICLADGFR